MTCLSWKSKDQERKVKFDFYNEWKWKFSDKQLIKALSISEKTLKRYIKLCRENFDYDTKCHGRNNFCKRLLAFHRDRKHKIYGYRRLFFAFKQHCLENGMEHLVKDELTKKQMYKIMKDHNIKGQNRTGLPYKKEVKQTNKWNKDMDLIQNNYSNDKTQPVWSMDIKYIHTKEGYLYINAIRDFYSQAIIGFWMLNEMSYEKLVLPSLNMAVDLYKKLDISMENLIVHTDNGKQNTTQRNILNS